MPETQVKLRKLVEQLHAECGITVEPLFPKILVRVLPKEQLLKSGLYLPDSAVAEQRQNKPIHEAIVLGTYKPFFQKVYLKDINWSRADWASEEDVKYVQKVECALKPGDHILFPHIEFGITPVWPLDDGVGEYRLVPEDAVLGLVNYDDITTKDWLEEFLDSNDDFDSMEELAQELLKNADIIRKDQVSKTLSGK